MKQKTTPIPKAELNRHVSATEKALNILDCFSAVQPELSLTQISQYLGIPKSTALNQIRTLENSGFLYRVKNTSNYRLGYKIMELNYSVVSAMTIVQYALPFMEMLRSAGNENVYLTTHLNGRVFYLECLHSNRQTIAYSVAGKTLPMHCTGCGKAMLSFMPQDQVDRIIQQHGLPLLTSNTCTDYDVLMKELAAAKAQGYAIECEESSVGTCCVASAIRTPKGEVAGALSVSGSVSSMTRERMQEYAKLLISACHNLSPYASQFPAIQLMD